MALRYRMISLTESAAKKIESLQNETADASKRLRIFVEAGGCSGLEYGMSFDVPKEGDQELESQGVKFLMDATSLATWMGLLSISTMDCREKDLK